MSMFYCCPVCGHNLTYIVDRRLKCYGCGKYFTENLICRCQRDRAFKFSAEIIAPNKVKCFFCHRESQVPASLEPPYIDKYRDGTGTGDSGSWDGQVSSFRALAQKPKVAKKSKQEVKETGKPEVDYVSENGDQIVIRFPGHSNLNQIRCEIVNGVLEVQSRLVDFFEKFSLHDFPCDLKTELRNAVLDIRLRKIKKS